MNNNDLILIGGGGHCKSVIDVAESAGYKIIGILDTFDKVGTSVLNYPIIGVDDEIAKYKDKALFLITVGQIADPSLRIKLHQKVIGVGGTLATIVASTAYVSKYATLGVGTIIMHHAMINANANIGSGCIINTFANVEHDTVIHDFCHISTGVMVNGGCVVNEGTFLGSQSVVSNGVFITNECVISAGSFVRKNITQKGIYAGNPATLKKANL